MYGMWKYNCKNAHCQIQEQSQKRVILSKPGHTGCASYKSQKYCVYKTKRPGRGETIFKEY